MTILRKCKADSTIWAPNFDHWLNVNRAKGTLPKEYVGLSRNDIARAAGATIWARTGILHVEHPNVEVVKEEKPGETIRTTYRTPVGEVETLHVYASDFTRALFLKEHMIKRVEDIAVVKYIAADARYTLDSAPYYQSEREVGDDGISLVGLPMCVPFIQFGKTDAGWVQGLYLWNDHRSAVEELLEAYTAKLIEAAKLLAQGPAEVVWSPDNMDELTMPPRLFKQYAIPYFQCIADILHNAGKILKVHWCGHSKRLLPLALGTGIDAVEAFSSAPMSDMTVQEALESVQGQIVLQGGVPAVLMCPQGGTRDDLRRYIEELLRRVPIGEKFVLGMGDNVPPDADFGRVKMISDIVNSLEH
jgi:hypothetical protein